MSRAELGAQLLAACAERRAADALRLLDAGGADLDVLDAARRSALMHACEDESGALDQVAARLIAGGAKLDLEDDNNGATALVKACAKRRAATALRLVRARAELDAVDVDEGMTALDYACARGLGKVAAAIFRRGGRAHNQIEAAREVKAAAAAVAQAQRPDDGDIVNELVRDFVAAQAQEKAAKALALRAVAAAVVASARDVIARDAAEREAATAAVREEATARNRAAAAAPPFHGPAADSPLGELFLDAIPIVCAHGHGLDCRRARYICGLTFRLGVVRSDGSLDRAGFLGGTADMIKCAEDMQAPWLAAARHAPRERALMPTALPRGELVARTTQLMRAAAANDERRVRELLAAGAPPRCVKDAPATALHYASIQGNERAIKALLEADNVAGALDKQTSTGNSALMLASYRGHKGAVRVLLAHGARLELCGFESGDTALHLAAKNGHSEVAALLCAAPGAAEVLRARNNGEDLWHLGLMGPAFADGVSALTIAAGQGHEMCAAVLREGLAL